MTSPHPRSTAVGAVSAIIAVGIAGILVYADRPRSSLRQEELPMTHTACPPLISVAEALEDDRPRRLRLAIETAKDVANTAYADDGISFGLPEKVAIRMATTDADLLLSDHPVREEFEDELTSALQECRD